MAAEARLAIEDRVDVAEHASSLLGGEDDRAPSHRWLGLVANAAGGVAASERPSLLGWDRGEANDTLLVEDHDLLDAPLIPEAAHHLAQQVEGAAMHSVAQGLLDELAVHRRRVGQRGDQLAAVEGLQHPERSAPDEENGGHHAGDDPGAQRVQYRPLRRPRRKRPGSAPSGAGEVARGKRPLRRGGPWRHRAPPCLRRGVTREIGCTM